MAKHPVSLKVNGDEYDLLIEPRKTLLAVLRDTIGLTGTKEGCSTGDCGACTVIVDGKAVTSCMVLGVTVSEKEITTIEGLASDGELHPVQQAFINTGGYQCGFCTPGFIMAAKALLDENPERSEEEFRYALGGNICRCTGYTKILEAVLKAAEEVRTSA
ncbi:(2Fe-2S)-binding protein [Candidatus Poribacteria bacterium]|nr:(2Fe-2S)-binding protein [Candidatus Poribacteria bacterium]MXV85865.1 (2Fe-2S)-binding protein [Candidatus Poribacteria bacterium]MYA55103.1 (2Fe-2S)-binding protein [Candidatus Poribacteria bacterium]